MSAPSPRPRRSTFKQAKIEAAEHAVSATLKRHGGRATLAEVLDYYDYFRDQSPSHTAPISDAIKTAISALETICETGAAELHATSHKHITAALAALRLERKARTQILQRANSGRLRELLEGGVGIPHSLEGGWRPRFAWLTSSVGLGARDIARAEALAVIRHDPLLQRYVGKPIYFDDASKAENRWKQLLRRQRAKDRTSSKGT